MSSPTGFAISGTAGPVFDSNGVAVPPQRPYTLLESWERSFVTEWRSVEEMAASLQYAPKAEGLPDGAPDPNTVFSEGGLLYRFVIDPDVTRQAFVARGEDGGEEVRERVQFRKQYVALTLAGARAETDKRNTERGDPETDFWCGYTWIRGGYSPERTAPVAVQMQSAAHGGVGLVFDQPASPTEAARIRHEVSRMDRVSPTLPIEAQTPKRGRGRPPSKPTEIPFDTMPGAEAPGED